MQYESMNLWENYDGDLHTDAIFHAYVPDNSPEIDMNRKRRAVLICPGGAYAMTSDREAEPVAFEFLRADMCAFVLRYSVAPNRHPIPLYEVSRAMWLIRQNAERWHVDPSNIAVMGFSAGGHLAGSLGVFWNRDEIAQALGMPKGMNQPNKLVLCYPVILFDEKKGHVESFYNLLGKNQAREVYESMSLERFVSADTPPTFLWHTYSDGAVPVDNSLAFAESLRSFDIPFEMHIYPSGVHGLSLGDTRTAGPQSPDYVEPYLTNWIAHCIAWLKR